MPSTTSWLLRSESKGKKCWLVRIGGRERGVGQNRKRVDFAMGVTFPCPAGGRSPRGLPAWPPRRSAWNTAMAVPPPYCGLWYSVTDLRKWGATTTVPYQSGNDGRGPPPWTTRQSHITVHRPGSLVLLVACATMMRAGINGHACGTACRRGAPAHSTRRTSFRKWSSRAVSQ